MAKIRFSKRRLDGLMFYPAYGTDKFRLWGDGGRFYLQIRTNKGYRYPDYAGDGFASITEAQNWLNMMDWENATTNHIEARDNEQDEDLEFAMTILGLHKESTPNQWMNTFENEDGQDFHIWVTKYADGLLHVDAYRGDKKFAQSSIGNGTYDVSKLIRIVDAFMQKYSLSSIECCELTETSCRDAIMAAITTKDLLKGLVRCKSSNVWGYNINIRDRKSGVGDMIMQFKGKNGGPGDVYIYYDVPVRTYRRMHTAPSKGHFFWVNIRNTFQYAKLTGNKRGVLPNAVN